MKKKTLIKSVLLTAVLIVSFSICQTSAFAADNSQLSMTLKGTGDEECVTLYSQEVNDDEYFLLPSGVKNKNITPNFSENKIYKTAQSANIASIFFVSADPEKKGMDYVNGSADHSAKAKGMVYMYDKTFKLIYSGEVSALKGRGNTTWAWTDKKPYQMKLEKKADLLDPANGTQKSKTWILLSNPFDPTLIKNTMVYNFAKEVGLETAPDGKAVDMYYDGIYRGSYYLCEKAEIGSSRVDIDDLEEAVEDANPDVDMDELSTAKGTNSSGNEYAYVQGLNDPENITGGYLLEIDNAYYQDEKSWITLGDMVNLVSKQPEYLSEDMAEYISEHCQDIYNYISTEHEKFGKGSKIFDYIDKESFARYLLTMEWFDNNDVWMSSTYLYKPADDDKLYAGPVWDCDSIMGIRRTEKKPTGWKANYFGKNLLALPEFRKALQEVYVNEFRPVIYDTLLGDTDGTYLKTYEHMKEEISASRVMNDMIWEYNNMNNSYVLEKNAEANYDSLYSLMETRAAWLDEAITATNFTKNTITVNRAKTPSLKTNYKNKTIKVTVPKTKYKANNIVSTKTKNATNYQVAYRVKGAKKWKTVKTGGKQTITLKKLKRNKTYQVKVRAIAKTNSGTKYGTYSKIKAVKIKKK